MIERESHAMHQQLAIVKVAYIRLSHFGVDPGWVLNGLGRLAELNHTEQGVA